MPCISVKNSALSLKYLEFRLCISWIRIALVTKEFIEHLLVQGLDILSTSCVMYIYIYNHMLDLYALLCLIVIFLGDM